MTFAQNLTRARGHLIFLVALVAGLVLVQWLDRLSAGNAGGGPRVMDAFDDVAPQPLAGPRPLTQREVGFARVAWTYFETNTDPATGFTNSADDYPSTTMWETGSYLVAILSAERLGLIDESEAVSRVNRVLTSLGQLRLFDDVLPNKAYHTATLDLVDYNNQPSEIGLGWSALDISRIVAALALVERNHPELTPAVETLMHGWQIDRMVADGELIGSNVVDGKIVLNQEGRVGYEQYAARALGMFGFDVSRAADVDGHLMAREVEGIPVPVDTRMMRRTLPAFVVSEPYLFEGLEFGFDTRSWRFATNVFRAQEARFALTGQLTAVSEGHLDSAPFFAYATVWGGGGPWSVLTSKGERIDSRRTLSTKAAFGWDALFGTDYTGQLVEAVSGLADPEEGWAEGLYEVNGTPNTSVTANTNAVVLAALSFRATGPLVRVPR